MPLDLKILAAVCCLMLGAADVYGAKILFAFHMPAPSHYSLGKALAVGLVEKGHEVTIISPFKVGKTYPNLKEIVLEDAMKKLHGSLPVRNLFDYKDISTLNMIQSMTAMGQSLSNYTLHHPGTQQLLKAGAKFDMFIAEVFTNEALFGLAYQFEAIPVGISTMATTKWTNEMMGNPNNPAYNPNLFLNLTPKMNYWQRVLNTLVVIADDVMHRINVCKQNTIYQEALAPFHDGPLPHLNDVITNLSLVLLNTNIAVGYPRANVPNMIDVGGIHIKDGVKLPKDIQQFLDGAKDGAIYFSMGSNLQSTLMPVEKRDAILKTFAKLKQRVLWKWEDTNLPNKPDNVLISKWMPQQSILEHPNVQLFITHGGLLSSLESVHFGVPLVGIPIFGDQYLNMARAINAGYGVQVDYSVITEESLTTAVRTVLDDTKYRDNVKRLSKIFRDAPQKPLEKAIYHVEYILRHKGAPFLHAPSLHLNHVQAMLLDVAAGICAVVLLLLATVCYSCKFVCRKIYGKKAASVEQRKKKN